MRLIDRLRGAERSTWPTGLSIDDYLGLFAYNGQQYPLGMSSAMPGSPAQKVDSNFVGYVHAVHNRNGIVAAAVAARSKVLSQIRFEWRSEVREDQGRRFGSAGLAPLERPGPTWTRTQLLSAAERHVSYAGNAFFNRNGNTIRLLNPEWVDVVLGTDSDPDSAQMDAEVIGYLYHRGGRKAGNEPKLYSPREVAHWMPEPDPAAWWRGESWVTSVLREITTDGQATDHLSKFYDHAATPQIIFSLDPSVTKDQATQWAEVINSEHAGTDNAWKNLIIGGGAEATVVGSNLAQLNYKDTQGGHESRIAVRSRVPAPVLGIREGMQGSSLNAGNYQQIRRLWADTWFTPTCDDLCASLERIIDQPDSPAELTFDPTRVMFLQEDMKDAADIAQTQAQAVRALVEAGYKPDAAAEAVAHVDIRKLVNEHTGTFSVQLQPPGGTEAAAMDAADAANREQRDARTLSAAEVSQKVYLAFTNGVLTRSEARQLIADAGAEIDPDAMPELVAPTQDQPPGGADSTEVDQ